MRLFYQKWNMRFCLLYCLPLRNGHIICCAILDIWLNIYHNGSIAPPYLLKHLSGCLFQVVPRTKECCFFHTAVEAKCHLNFSFTSQQIQWRSDHRWNVCKHMSTYNMLQRKKHHAVFYWKVMHLFKLWETDPCWVL